MESNQVRTIGVVTVGRSDYGIYESVLKKISEDSSLRVMLFVGGAHLETEFGSTIELIEKDGFHIAEKIPMSLKSDTPESIATSMGVGVAGFAQAYARNRPDILIILGDRFDMYSAALAALPFKIPVAHIHGGEVTDGAMDDALRHSITKLSHLHFVSTEEYKRRVIQLGEEPWRVVVSGAPSLDGLENQSLFTTEELKAKFGIAWNKPPLIVTFHPVTLEYEQTAAHIGELLAALDAVQHPVVFTMPNADTSHRIIREQIERFVATRSWAQAVENLGRKAYFSLMTYAAAMVGNSSSGILEAASFKLPVVNIGSRQRGRVFPANVIQVETARSEILAGIHKALGTRDQLKDLINPYGNGTAAEKIVQRLKTVELNDHLIVKKFFDLDTVDVSIERNYFKNAISNKRAFCFDIDGVIATQTSATDYGSAGPIVDNIRRINALYDAGHEITLFTARGTMTGIDWKEVTENQMKKWGVKHHRLLFGKPAADVYVDDRMISLDTLREVLK